MTRLNKFFIAPAFAVALFSAQSITAQNQNNSSAYDMDAREELKVGIKAGANFSNVYSESGDGFIADGKLGFAGGLFVSIPLGKFIGIQPELLYSQKGFKSEGSFLGVNYEGSTTFNYLDLPLHLQLKPTANISILAGPQLSYLLSSKYELNGLSSTQQQDFEDENNRATLGVSAGIDFTVDSFLISARGSWDLSKVNEDNSTSDLNYKNQVLQVTVGYRF
jgi:hypothetical protein